MIGTIDIEIQAHNPQFPLHPINAIVGSPSSVRLRNVPKKIGEWKIERVYIEVRYPDNQTIEVDTKLVGGVYVGTFDGCSISGTSTKGFIVKADGVDENGTPVNGYVLGVGDIYIIDGDGKLDPEQFKFIKLNDEQPETPMKGDAFFDDGTLKIFDGQDWKTCGGSGSGVVESKRHQGWAESADEAEWAYYADEANIASWASKADYIEWSKVADKPTIPTKTSELENDSGFYNEVEVQATVEEAINVLKDFTISPLSERVDGVQQQCDNIGNDISAIYEELTYKATNEDIEDLQGQLNNAEEHIASIENGLGEISQTAYEALNKANEVDEQLSSKVDNETAEISDVLKMGNNGVVLYADDEMGGRIDINGNEDDPDGHGLLFVTGKGAMIYIDDEEVATQAYVDDAIGQVLTEGF